MAAIDVQNLVQTVRTGFWLQKKTLLHSVSVSLPEGKTTAVIGPNGAGKSTLFQILTGIRAPASGKVEIFGKPISQVKNWVGYLPERPYFYEFLTAKKFLRVMGTYSGMSRDQINARSLELLKTVKLDHVQDSELRSFSKGMLQRIGIAQALIHNPRLVVFDEPMSGLDPVGREEVRNLMIDLKRQGVTLVFSTHLLADLDLLCDWLVVIQKGSVLYSGSLEDLKKIKSDQYEQWLTGVFR